MARRIGREQLRHPDNLMLNSNHESSPSCVPLEDYTNTIQHQRGRSPTRRVVFGRGSVSFPHGEQQVREGWEGSHEWEGGGGRKE